MSEFKRESLSDCINDSAEVPADGLEKVRYAIDAAKCVKTRRRSQRKKRITQMVTTAFAVMLIAVPNLSADAAVAMSELPVIGNFFEAVTFRDYHYSSERFQADVSVPEIIEGKNDASGAKILAEGDAAEINRKINEIADGLIDEFKLGMEENSDGYSSLYVNYEILHTADTYFTLKLITFQGAGSGFEQHYYYTLDINTGKEIKLSDLFRSGCNYITPISENIKAQMREKMSDEENGSMFWVDIDKDDPIYEWAFQQIDAEQQFYVNADGDIVIAFDEGEVAPMYMGTQEFVIPQYVTERLR